ncbi:ribosomal protein S27AE [Bradyrhizobium sp. LB7.1]
MVTTSTAPKIWTRETGLVEKRDVWTAMKRGFRGRCPRCGEGKLFRAFLKTADNCSRCGLDFTPHRADDLPAYLVIVIVGHIVGADYFVDRDQLHHAGLDQLRGLPALHLRRLARTAAAGQGRRGRIAMGSAYARV